MDCGRTEECCADAEEAQAVELSIVILVGEDDEGICVAEAPPGSVKKCQGQARKPCLKGVSSQHTLQAVSSRSKMGGAPATNSACGKPIVIGPICLDNNQNSYPSKSPCRPASCGECGQGQMQAFIIPPPAAPSSSCPCCGKRPQTTCQQQQHLPCAPPPMAPPYPYPPQPPYFPPQLPCQHPPPDPCGGRPEIQDRAVGPCGADAALPNRTTSHTQTCGSAGPAGKCHMKCRAVPCQTEGATRPGTCGDRPAPLGRRTTSKSAICQTHPQPMRQPHCRIEVITPSQTCFNGNPPPAQPYYEPPQEVCGQQPMMPPPNYYQPPQMTQPCCPHHQPLMPQPCCPHQQQMAPPCYQPQMALPPCSTPQQTAEPKPCAEEAAEESVKPPHVPQKKQRRHSKQHEPVHHKDKVRHYKHEDEGAQGEDGRKGRRDSIPADEINWTKVPERKLTFVDYFLKFEGGSNTVVKLADAKHDYEKKCKAKLDQMDDAAKQRSQDFFMRIIDVIQVKIPGTNNTEIKHYHVSKYIEPILQALNIRVHHDLHEVHRYQRYIVSVVNVMGERERQKLPIDPDALVEVETRILAGIMSRVYPIFLRIKEVLANGQPGSHDTLSPEDVLKQLRKLLQSVYIEISCIELTFMNTLTGMGIFPDNETQDKYVKMMTTKKKHARHCLTWGARCIATVLLYYKITGAE